MDLGDMSQMLKMIEIFKTIGGANNGKTTEDTPTEEVKVEAEPEVKNILPRESIETQQVRYFDDSIHTNSIKNIKAMVPYMDYNVQKNIAIMVKFFELQKTIEMYNSNEVRISSIEEDTDWKRGMLSAVRAHSTDENKNVIDMITTLIDLKEAMQKMKGAKG